MKKKLAIILIVAFAFTLFGATVAYAAPNDNGNQGGNMQDRIDKAQERLAFLEEIQPLIQQMTQNRGQIKSLKTQLREQIKLAKAHIDGLKGDIDNVTDEQLAQLTQLKTQLQQCRVDLAQTNPTMTQQRQQIRTARRNRNYDTIKAAYGKVISAQQQRMETLRQMIQLNEQICQI